MRFELPDGVRLRVLAESDADELFAVVRANQAHLAPWLPWAAGELRIARTRAFVRACAAQHAEGQGFTCAVVQDGRIVGSVGFHRVDWLNGRTSLTYWLAADAQGRGTMTAAVRQLVDHAFRAWDLHRVAIEAAPGNRRSRAIPQRLGFTEEGVLREVERVGARWLDRVVYGLLDREWRARQAPP